MNTTKALAMFAAAAACAFAQAADIYVSLETGKNKNPGTKEAPLKNLWKALEQAQTGDTIHVAGAAKPYPGKATSKGTFRMERPVSIIGGYSPDFSARAPLKHRTLLQAANDTYTRGNNLGVLHLEFDKTPAAPKGVKMKIDGLIFDEGFANSYHAVKGKPEGFDTGMWLEGPAKNIADKQVSPNRYMIYSATASRVEGELEIENCAFVNCGNIAVNINWFKGKVKIENCVFCNNRMIGASVACSAAVPMDGPSRPRAGWKPEVEWEFEKNTVLYTWSRLNDLADMGFGVRVNTGVKAEIEDNIIGLNVLTGFDNTKGVAATKKIKLDGNVFFLNRESDVQMTASPSVVKVRVEEFEDLEGVDGIEEIEGNVDLKDPSVFKGRLDPKFLNAFLTMKYSEKTKLDDGKCNALRSVLGLPQQGTITTKCDMFCNRYPLEEALKLFGAMKGKGAQDIK